jgi:hypothetical protein
LVGHEAAAEKTLGGGLDVLGTPAEDDPPGLPASAAVDLGLDDPELPAEALLIR